MITLLIAALVFGIIGFFTTKYLSGIITDILDGNRSDTPVINAPEETDDDDDKLPDGLKVPDGESFTMLFVGTDYRPDLYTNYYTTLEDIQKIVDEANKKATDTEETKKPAETNKKDETENAESAKASETTTSKSRAKDEPKEIKEPDSVLKTDIRYIRATWIVLVRADKENREYVSCYISPETAVTAPCGESDLGEVYGLYGLDTLSEFISVMTGLEIDYRFVLDAAHQKKIADVLGGVDFELDSNIYLSKEDYVSVQPADEDSSDGDSSGTEAESTKESSSESETEAEEKHLALKKGKHEFGKDTVDAINGFDEKSAADIDVKSKYILEIVEQYLFKASATEVKELEKNLNKLTTLSYIDNPDGTPAQDYKYDINDPYATKATIGSDFNAEDTEFYKSMLEAIQYFDYVELNYPGTYSDDEGLFRPDVKAALSQFERYRASSRGKDASASMSDETTGAAG
ncbi:MAG: hypothetical protein IJO81_00535 [Clostridia bacterium]|nr:hypothetical protein [Clostridia bacterium]